MKTKIYKGFTLIELLIVIAIIGILASIVLVSLNSAKVRAETAALKATISSLQPAVTMCCDSSANDILTTIGGDVCSNAVGALLPTAANMKASGVTYTENGGAGVTCAQTTPTLTVTPSGTLDTDCSAAITVTAEKVTYPAACS